MKLSNFDMATLILKGLNLTELNCSGNPFKDRLGSAYTDRIRSIFPNLQVPIYCEMKNVEISFQQKFKSFPIKVILNVMYILSSQI